MADTGKKFTPPYGIPWATFHNTVERMTPETLPNRVDRTYLPSMSGNTQTYLISSLKGFGLINDKMDVEKPLEELVAANPAERKTLVAGLLEQYYPDQVALGQTNATMGQLEESFTKSFPSLTGDSKRKAITFFLHAAEYAGVKRSPLWAMKKRGGGGGGGSRRPKTPQRQSSETPAARRRARNRTPDASPTRTVNLRSGGFVTLAYSVDLFEASDEDRAFLTGLIDKMKAYENQRALPSGGNSSATGGGEE